MSAAVASPPANRRARKRRQLTDRIAGIAFDLFEEAGYEGVTMERIAAAADIAKGTLYKHFAAKEALLAHRFQQEITAWVTPLWPALERQGGFAAQMSYLLRAWTQWNEARRTYIPHYVRHQLSSRSPGRHDLRQIFERLCRAGQQRGEVRSDLPAAHLAVLLEWLCLGAIVTWLARPDANLQHEFDALLRVALNGVAAQTRPRNRQP